MEERTIQQKLVLTYRAIIRLLNSPDADWKTKVYASTALAYLTNPKITGDDVEKAYLKKYYISTLVFNDLFVNRPEVIRKIVSRDSLESVHELLRKDMAHCASVLHEEAEQIKMVSGYSALAVLELSNDETDSRTYVLRKLKAELLGAVSFFYAEIKESNYAPRLYIQTLSESEEFYDIDRIHRKVIGEDQVLSDQFEEDISIEELLNVDRRIAQVHADPHTQALLKRVTQIFSILCDIAVDSKCNPLTILEINSAISYYSFVSDFINDSRGATGYTDDLFIGCFVLCDIAERQGELLARHLPDNFSTSLIYNTFNIVTTQLEEETGRIMNLLGLKGLLTYFDVYDPKRKQSNPYRAEIIFINKLKNILCDLARYYYKGKFEINRRLFANLVLAEIKHQMESVSEEEQKLLERYITISQEIAQIKSAKREKEEHDEQELNFLLLKYKLLSTDA